MKNFVHFKEKVFLSLWMLSGIYIVICGIPLLGIQSFKIFNRMFFIMLLLFSFLTFVIDLVPKKSVTAVEDLELLPDEDYSEPIKEHMYIRSERYKNKEERYITDLEGHVYYKIKIHRYGYETQKYDVYRCYNNKMAQIIRYRRGKSELYKYVLKINGKEYHAEIFSQADDTLTEESPYIFDFNETNDFKVIDKKTNKVIAYTRGVYTEAGYSNTDQDVMVYKKDIDPSVILLLASLTFTKNAGSYHN